MVKRSFQALSLIMIIALIALTAFSVVASGGEEEGESGGLMRHLHALGEKLHGHGSGGHHSGGGHGGGHHAGHHGDGLHGDGLHGNGMGHHMAHAAELVEQLNLTEAQSVHFENIHKILGAFGSEGHGSMAELHNQLIEEFESGYMTTDNVHGLVDQHLEEMRTMAYGISDELVALVNGLDADQRATLQAHVDKMK